MLECEIEQRRIFTCILCSVMIGTITPRQLGSDIAIHAVMIVTCDERLNWK